MRRNTPEEIERQEREQKLEQFRLSQWAEVRYWIHLQLEKGVDPSDVMNQLGLTIQGYDALMSTDDRAVHQMTVGNANARVRAWELRYNEGYKEFAKNLIASKTGW